MLNLHVYDRLHDKFNESKTINPCMDAIVRYAVYNDNKNEAKQAVSEINKLAEKHGLDKFYDGNGWFLGDCTEFVNRIARRNA